MFQTNKNGLQQTGKGEKGEAVDHFSAIIHLTEAAD